MLAVRRSFPLSMFFVAWFSTIYLPCLGRGFIRDDFAWIGDSTLSSLADVTRLFRPASGFYRPVVGLSFAADRALFDLAPLPYALTNLGLLIMCAIAVFMLAREFKLSTTAGVVAAGVWSLNPHAVNTTLLWMSGRTGLLLTLFAVSAAVAFKRGRSPLSALFTLLALLSKEEAVMLPFVFAAWAAIDTRTCRGAAAKSWLPFLALLAYALLRSGSEAMTPWTAPTGYRFTLSLAHAARNFFEYADRTCTFGIVFVGLVALAARAGGKRPPVSTHVLVELLIWLVALFALTMFLPLRSGLYVLAPSVGVAISAGAWFTHIVCDADETAQRRVSVLLLVLAVISVPIYWTRNAPDVRRGELTSRVLREVVPVVRTLPPGSVVMLHDHRDGPATMEDAFGALTTEAVTLFSGRHDLTVWVEPVPFDLRLAGVKAPNRDAPRAVFDLRQGQLRRSR